MIKQKKGTGGATITWFVGVLFIAVILGGWGVAIAGLSLNKNIGDNDIKFQNLEGFGVLETQEILLNVLNSLLSEGITVKEKIIDVEKGNSEYGDNFEEEVREMIKESSSVFIFEIDGSEDVKFWHPDGIIRSSLYEAKVSIFVEDREVNVILQQK
ncbi:MAG: hypothetical protein ABIB47_02200 [Candidatus Woesearchaeota archaeon]